MHSHSDKIKVNLGIMFVLLRGGYRGWIQNLQPFAMKSAGWVRRSVGIAGDAASRVDVIAEARKYGEVVVGMLRDAALSGCKPPPAFFLRTAQAHIFQNLVVVSPSPVVRGFSCYEGHGREHVAAPTKLKKSVCRSKSF
jgi:hypothetical protein